MQRDAKSRGHLAEFHYGSAEAPHTEAYLLPQIVTLCAELGVRRVIDIGCCNGARCPELASRGYEVVGRGAFPLKKHDQIAQKPEEPRQ